MREYTRIILEQLIILVPLGEVAPSHGILCESEQQAHEYKLALGLGTYPDPEKAPQNYKEISLVSSNENSKAEILFPLFQIQVFRDEEIDEPPSNCCESYCPGCPFTLKSLRRNCK